MHQLSTVSQYSQYQKKRDKKWMGGTGQIPTTQKKKLAEAFLLCHPTETGDQCELTSMSHRGCNPLPHDHPYAGGVNLMAPGGSYVVGFNLLVGIQAGKLQIKSAHNEINQW